MSVADRELASYSKILDSIYLLLRGEAAFYDKVVLAWLSRIPEKFIEKITRRRYRLRKSSKFMLITSLVNCVKQNKCNYYTIQVIECFFTPKLQDTSSQSRSKPMYLQITLPSNKKLQLYDILLMSLPKVISSSYDFSPKSFLQVFHYFEIYKHPLHKIISRNCALIKNLSIHTIQERSVSTKKNNQEQKICFVVKHNGQYKIKNLKDHIIVPVQVSQKALQALPKYALLLLDEKNEIKEVLGSLLDSQFDRKIAMLIQNYVSQPFSKKALEEAQNVAKSLVDIQGEAFNNIKSGKSFDATLRYDLSHLPFYAIDPEGAKDHDDAIYYDSFHGILYVAIADVSEYVIMNGALDKEALQKSFSMYFPNYVYPMLPHILSSEACSLKSCKMRLALVWEIRLHKRTSKILSSRVFKAVVKVRASLTYNEVEVLLHGKTSNVQDLAVQESLFAFFPMAQLLYKKRIANGFDLRLRDYNFLLNDDESIREVNLCVKTQSHMVVEEAMLLANQESAKLLAEINCGIFRNHESPKVRDLNHLIHMLGAMGYESAKIKNSDFSHVAKNEKILKKNMAIFAKLSLLQKQAVKKGEHELVDFLIVRHFKKADYGNKNLGHFGLGFSCYTHFTSPIRRYADLIVHRIISAYLQNNQKQLHFIYKEALEMLPRINKMELCFDAIESFYKKLKSLRYACSIVPFYEKVLIYEITKNIAYGLPIQRVGYCYVKIACEDCLLEIGMIIDVKVTLVDFETLSLYAELI